MTEEREDVRVEEVISSLIGDEFDRIDEVDDAKERQMAIGNVMKGVQLLVDTNKLQQDIYDREQQREADKAKVDMNAYIEQKKIDLERDRLNWERDKAKIDEQVALDEAKQRKIQFAIDVSKIVVDVALTVTGMIVANNLMFKEAVINETGSIRNACGKNANKMAEGFLKKVERRR